MSDGGCGNIKNCDKQGDVPGATCVWFLIIVVLIIIPGTKKIPRTSPHLVNRKLLGIPLTNSLLAHVNNRHLDVGTHQSHNGARRAANIPSSDAANLLDRESRKIRETVRVAVLHVN